MIEITYAVRKKKQPVTEKNLSRIFKKRTMFFFHLQHVNHKSCSWVKNISVKFNWFKMKMKSTILQNGNEKNEWKS